MNEPPPDTDETVDQGTTDESPSEENKTKMKVVKQGYPLLQEAMIQFAKLKWKMKDDGEVLDEPSPEPNQAIGVMKETDESSSEENKDDGEVLEEPSPEPNQAIGNCIVCGEEDRRLFKGTRYQCHESCSVEEQMEHNKMCYSCASGAHDHPECPIHHQPLHEDYNTLHVEPTLINDEPLPIPHHVLGDCIGCGVEDTYLYKGSRYQCHITASHQLEHDEMCYNCASGCDHQDCPIHHQPLYDDHSQCELEPLLSSSEPPPESHQAVGECIVCGEADRHLFKATRYQCHQEVSEEQQMEHDRMCYDCARASYDNPECPIHHLPAHEDLTTYNIEPVYDE